MDSTAYEDIGATYEVPPEPVPITSSARTMSTGLPDVVAKQAFTNPAFGRDDTEDNASHMPYMSLQPPLDDNVYSEAEYTYPENPLKPDNRDDCQYDYVMN